MRTVVTKKRLSWSVAVIMVSLFAVVACGNDDSPATADESLLDLTQDPDAYERLVEAAKAEGEVVLYTSLESGVADQLAAMFEDEYGIPVIVQRSGGSDILQRFLIEADSGHIQNDVLGIGGDAGTISALMKDGYFECFIPRQWNELHEWARDPAGCWTASRATVMVLGYRTDLLEQMGIDPPTSWADMTRPELAGRVGMPNPNFSSAVKQMVAVQSENLGWEWFEALRDNDPVIVRGNGPLLDALETGEIVMGGPSTQPRLVEAKLAGDPIDFVYPSEGTVMGPSPHVVVKGAKNPHAGRLLVDFLLTEPVQQMLLDRGDYVGLASMPAGPGLLPVDQLVLFDFTYEWANEHGDERAAMFTEIFDAETE